LIARNRHQIPDDKTRVVVVGHSFISHLKTRIDDGRVSFEDPKEHPGKFHPLFVGLPGATLEMLSNYVRSTHLLEQANEAVSNYHYPCLVVGNLVTIPKSGEEETKNVLARVTLVDAGSPVGVGYGVVDEIVG
jgi:hypothetical protein